MNAKTVSDTIESKPGSGSKHSSRSSWERPALALLLATTGVLYLWGLGRSGWANTFYSAAVQAGTKSWKAFFFGSSDAANFITVDKTPGSLWIMDLSARAFGVNAWSILVPQALEGVGAVAVLYATVRRWFSPAAALIAGAVLAFTPVATLMFRFNNPDALLVLLLTIGAYAITRACEDGRSRWVVLAGTVVGCGFLAKMLQSLLVVPVFALVYFVAAPVSVRRRIGQLFLGGLAMIVAAGWYVLTVQLTPAADRPYIGGSQDNSLWNLIFGYNGFGRLTGNEAGSVVGGNQGVGTGGAWGSTGITRLFSSEMGSQISWIIPAALILLVATMIMRGRAQRSDRVRTAMLLWGGWLLLTGAVFSFGQGIIHPYYTVALAPALGGLVGVGTVALWQQRSRLAVRFALALAIAVTAVWAYVILGRTDWNSWLRWLILVGGMAVAVAIVLVPDLSRRLSLLTASVALTIGLAAPASYSLQTASTAHSGALPSAGPGSSMRGGPGGPGQAGNRLRNFNSTGTFGNTFRGIRPRTGSGMGKAGGGAGGLLNGSTPTAALTELLESDGSRYTWAAAVVGSNEAAGFQLATRRPIMAIGGFNGTDPAPTLSAFEDYVAANKVHYFVSTGSGGSGTAAQITQWVQTNFRSTLVGDVTVFDLASPNATS